MGIKQIKSAKDLRVYKEAYELAMEIFEISKNYERLKEKCRSVGKMLGSMLKNPESFILRL